MKQVLIIEDNEDNMYMIKYILEKNNYKVITASTGQEGFEIAIQEKPDLVFRLLTLIKI